MSYFNTTALDGSELRAAIAVAKSQDEQVLALFRRHARIPLSPSQVWRLGYADHGIHWLLTSVRRAITDLTDDGYLTKCERKVKGFYNRPELTWQITPPASPAPAE